MEERKHEVAIVDMEQARRDAYMLGYGRFEGVDGDEFDLSGFRSGATYANETLPSLRAAAGFADGGHGTYQIARVVALVTEDDDLDDEPAVVERTDSRAVLDTLVDEWALGANDAAQGNDPSV